MVMDERCLLAVFAHPDDEAFGVAGIFRRYADQGVRTALVCATRGEEGEISDPALATPATLGQVREGELRDAAAIMGVDDLTFLDYRDATLARADRREAVGKVVGAIRRLRPQVVVTFDAKGGYGHPDHIAIHRLTVEAFHQAGDPACYPEQLGGGLEPFAPQKLYIVALPRARMRAVRERMRAQGVELRPGGNAATIPIEEMGVPDEQITTTIPLSDRELDAKLRTMRAHRSQMKPDSPLNRLPPDAVREWLGTERFVLLYPEGAPGNGAEHDLFAGL
jgi:LmbE family N-acetylglucosaminyl deacetylase